MKQNVFNMAGKKIGSVEVNDSVFACEYNEALIHQVVVAQLANKRQGTMCNLTRTEVRGGGAKPYRQKGTGRARQGSIVAPQYVGGGVVFAKKPRDFSQKINKRMNKTALYSALSEKLRQNELVLIDKFELPEVKTKHVAAAAKAAWRRRRRRWLPGARLCLSSVGTTKTRCAQAPTFRTSAFARRERSTSTISFPRRSLS